MIKKKIIEYFYITLGVIILGTGVYFFIMPHNLVIGGVSGLGLVFSELFGLKTSLVVLVLNMFFLLLGTGFYGRNFFLKTVYGSLLFPAVIFLWEISKVQTVTNNLLLAVIWSGITVGSGLGIVLKFGGTTGGLDIPQKILKDKLKIPYSVGMYATDGAIILFGALTFGIEKALYSILGLVLMGKIIDYILIGGKSTKSIYIISKQHKLIKKEIFEAVERGITEMTVVGGYSGQEKIMLVCVVLAKESYRVLEIVREIDSFAFVYVSSSTEVLGEGFNVHDTSS